MSERVERRIGWHRNRSRSKVTWLQVADLRRWARSEGYGLTPAEQVRRLRQLPPYADLRDTTVIDILRNHTWYDPDYHPLKQMDDAEDGTLQRFLLWVMVWTWLSRFRGAVAPSVGMLPGVQYEETA